MRHRKVAAPAAAARRTVSLAETSSAGAARKAKAPVAHRTFGA